jgi:uncharacterized protein (TIGR03083 family)
VPADLPALYRDSQERLAALVRDLSADQLAAPVPACPAWSVQDVVAHLVGVADDLVTGNLQGAMTEGWTAAQVERGRGASVPELLDRWDQLVPTVAEQLSVRRSGPVVIDVAAHEQDVRGAVDLPGARDNPTIRALTRGLLRALEVPVPLLVRTEDGDVRVGPDGDDPVVLTTTRFEAFRWRLGRRSRAQLAAMAWSGDPTPYLDHLSVFGPARTDVIE